MPLPAHFGEVCWGFEPLNVVGIVETPERHTPKNAFWRIDRADGSRNAMWTQAEKKPKIEKENKKKHKEM